MPELLEKVDGALDENGKRKKGIGFMPAVELSYIRPKNQRLIAVSMDGEQTSPSVAQAKRLRELDEKNLLNGDVIDQILCEEKKEVGQVIISTSELNKYGAAGRVERKATPGKARAGADGGAVTPLRHFVPKVFFFSLYILMYRRSEFESESPYSAAGAVPAAGAGPVPGPCPHGFCRPAEQLPRPRRALDGA